MTTFGSVCSGIEAASVAWHPLGFRAAWLAEIDPFCCELLHHHYGAGRPKYMPLPELAKDDEEKQAREAAIKAVSRIPEHGKLTNYGDITQVRDGEMEHVDVLVGGTPCQSFSIAGNRGGLNDARGNLTLRFVEIADAIQPVSILWENVPGVLSDKTNGFGCLLGGLAGTGAPLVPGRNQRWTDCGVVNGPGRRLAWRILDAQWFGLAQRRERVFVMASPRNRTHPAEVLLERNGLFGNHPPRREERERITGTPGARTSGGGGLDYSPAPPLTASGRGVERAGESRGQDCVIPVQVGPTLESGNNRTGGVRPPGTTVDTAEYLIPVHLSNGQISHCLNAGGMGRIDYETETLVTHALRADGFDASEDGTGRGTPLIPVAFRTSANYGAYETGDRIDALTTGTDQTSHVIAVSSTGDGYWNESETIGTLRSRAQESHEHLIAFSCKDSGADAGAVSPTLRAMEFDKSHANGGGQVAVAFRAAGQEGFTPSEVSPPVANSDGGGSGVPTVMTFEQRIGRNGRGGLESVVPPLKAESGQTGKGDSAPCAIIQSPTGWAVRRLTPIETARLQGFSDTYCHIPRKPRKIDPEEAAHYLSHGIDCWQTVGQWWTKAPADGPIYKSHGNSMATNVMSWLGARIKDSLREV